MIGKMAHSIYSSIMNDEKTTEDTERMKKKIIIN